MSTRISVTVTFEDEGHFFPRANFNTTTSKDFSDVAAAVGYFLKDITPAADARDDYDELELHLARNDAADKKSADEIDVNKNPSLKQGW